MKEPLFLITFSLFFFFFLNKCSSDLIHLKSQSIRGALIDEYSKKALIIKIKSPTDVITDVIKKMDFDKMGSTLSKEFRVMFGRIEHQYQSQFKKNLATHQEMIATPYPIETLNNNKNSQIIDVSNISSRSKRSPLRFLISLLRIVRPVARVGGKLTKYGKFMKGLKYSGYVASAAVFTYELVDIFGAIPDIKYEQLSRELDQIHKNREKDLLIMRNITLMTMNNNEDIMDLTQSVTNAIISSENKLEIQIGISQIFSSYLQQLSIGLLILMMGKIPTSIVSLDLQRSWLEGNIPHVLLNDIGSISPHLKLSLKAIDEDKNQLIIVVEVPTINSRFQILNYVEWEPKIIKNNICHTSPIPMMYLAYKPQSHNDIIENPLLINPSSCLREGFIMCESDAVTDTIPDMSINKICTKLLNREDLIDRKKRDTSDLYLLANSPTYDIEKIINETIIKEESPKYTNTKIKELLQTINNIIEDEKRQQKEFHILRGKADTMDKIIKGISIMVGITVFIILVFAFKFLNKQFNEYKVKRIKTRNKKLREELGIENSSV